MCRVGGGQRVGERGVVAGRVVGHLGHASNSGQAGGRGAGHVEPRPSGCRGCTVHIPPAGRIERVDRRHFGLDGRGGPGHAVEGP